MKLVEDLEPQEQLTTYKQQRALVEMADDFHKRQKSHKTEIFTIADLEIWLSLKDVNFTDRHIKSINRE